MLLKGDASSFDAVLVRPTTVRICPVQEYRKRMMGKLLLLFNETSKTQT